MNLPTYDKVERIKRYATNTVDDYFRLMLIENWNEAWEIDDETLAKYMSRMRKFCTDYRLAHPGDVAYSLCKYGLRMTKEQLEFELYGKEIPNAEPIE